MSLLHRLNPFAGLPNPRAVWAWGMYDLAHQSFTLLITTIYYAIYFKNVVVGDESRGTALWGYAFGIASVIIVLVSPLLGAMADFSGRKKAFLIGTGIGCTLFTCSLALTGPGTIWQGMTLYIIACVFYMAGDNFVAAFLPELSTRETVGKISAIGWTMGYVGALLCIPISAVILLAMSDSSGPTRLAMQVLFAFAGLWFFANMIPTMLFIKERKQPEPLPPGSTLLGVGFSRLWQSARQVGHFRQLAVYLLFFLIYSSGVQTFIVFIGALAEKYLSDTMLLVMTWCLAAVSGVAAFGAGVVQDRIGHKTTVVIALLVWLGTALAAAALPEHVNKGDPAPWFLWPLGIGMGIGLGAIGTASRAMVGVMTPSHKTAEFFGLWGLSLKGAGAIGPPIFGLVSSMPSMGQRGAMFVVAGFFALGLVGMLFVRPEAGKRAAEESERALARA